MNVDEFVEDDCDLIEFLVSEFVEWFCEGEKVMIEFYVW